VQTVAGSWTTLTFSNPDFDSQVASFIADCQSADGGSHTLPNTTSAEIHLEASLRCVYSGAFKGTFTGSDSGTFGIIIDCQTGEVLGAAYNYSYDDMTDAHGSGIVDYDQNMSFITGFADAGPTFDGQLTTANSMSGTWQGSESSYRGTFSGTRIGGDPEASYRYTGVANYFDPGYGNMVVAVLAMDVSDGIITGVAYDIESNEQSTISGTLLDSTITASSSTGVKISGTMSGDDSFYGTWNDPENMNQGTFDGSGCQLN
jgi:hypothetical protein